jgi:hypothetical protein
MEPDYITAAAVELFEQASVSVGNGRKLFRPEQ